MKALLSTLLLGASLSVQAAATDGLGLVYDGNSDSLNVTTSGTDDYATGAILYHDAAGNSFAAYCVDLAQDYLTGGPADFSVYRFGAATESLLQGLYASHYASLSSGFQQAAFQSAVWEITHETAAGPLSVSSGAFTVDEVPGGDTLAFKSLVDQYLVDAAGYAGPQRYQVFGLGHPLHQDLVSAVPVPEPTSAALLGIGLLGLAWRKRKA